MLLAAPPPLLARFLDKAGLLCSAARSGADPPGKRLRHRDTFFYPNEQSAGLISALSRPMHAAIPLPPSPPFNIVYPLTIRIAETRNQITRRNSRAADYRG